MKDQFHFCDGSFSQLDQHVLQYLLPTSICLTGTFVCVFFFFFWQQLSEESQMRIELQMALDSKDSDIEQLRNLLQSLSVQSLDSASVNSGPEFDTDDAYTGKSLPTGKPSTNM